MIFGEMTKGVQRGRKFATASMEWAGSYLFCTDPGSPIYVHKPDADPVEFIPTTFDMAAEDWEPIPEAGPRPAPEVTNHPKPDPTPAIAGRIIVRVPNAEHGVESLPGLISSVEGNQVVSAVAFNPRNRSTMWFPEISHSSIVHDPKQTSWDFAE